MSKKPAGIDRRASRTRYLLAQALRELGAEQGLDTLEVGDLAEAAGVARSTFYTHYANKQDFLSRSFVGMISAMEAQATRDDPARTELLPARHIFAHVAEAPAFALQVVKSDEQVPMMIAGEQKLRAIVEANLERHRQDWTPLQRREAAVFIAAGFIGLLRWWMENGVQKTPQQMSGAFARLTENVLSDV